MKISNELKVGFLASISMLCLVLGYNFLIGKSLFSHDNKYYAVYDNVDGLTVARPIKVNGFQIGKVSNLNLLPDGKIIAELLVNEKYQIPKHSVAKIESSDLMGNKAILLYFSSDNEIATDKDTLNAALQVSFSTAIKPMQDKTENVLKELSITLKNINSTFNQNFQNDFERTSKALAQTSVNLALLTSKINQNVAYQEEKANSILNNIDHITSNLNENNSKISSTLNNLNQISGKIAQAELDKTLKETQKTVQDMHAIFKKINEGEGSLGKLVNNEQFYNNLNDLITDLKSNPKRYVHFSIFGRKNKSK